MESRQGTDYIGIKHMKWSDNMTEISNQAQKFYEFMKQEYIENGYMYSGSINGRGFQRGGLSSNWEEFRRTVDELKCLGLLVIRECDTFAVELPLRVRKQMIIEHKLDILWEEKGSCFNPNGLYGEVSNTLFNSEDNIL